MPENTVSDLNTLRHLFKWRGVSGVRIELFVLMLRFILRFMVVDILKMLGFYSSSSRHNKKLISHNNAMQLRSAPAVLGSITNSVVEDSEQLRQEKMRDLQEIDELEDLISSLLSFHPHKEDLTMPFLQQSEDPLMQSTIFTEIPLDSTIVLEPVSVPHIKDPRQEIETRSALSFVEVSTTPPTPPPVQSYSQMIFWRITEVRVNAQIKITEALPEVARAYLKPR